MCFKQGYEQFHAVDSCMIFFICPENIDFVLSEAINTKFFYNRYAEFFILIAISVEKT